MKEKLKNEKGITLISLIIVTGVLIFILLIGLGIGVLERMQIIALPTNSISGNHVKKYSREYFYNKMTNDSNKSENMKLDITYGNDIKSTMWYFEDMLYGEINTSNVGGTGITSLYCNIHQNKAIITMPNMNMAFTIKLDDELIQQAIETSNTDDFLSIIAPSNDEVVFEYLGKTTLDEKKVLNFKLDVPTNSDSYKNIKEMANDNLNNEENATIEFFVDPRKFDIKKIEIKQQNIIAEMKYEYNCVSKDQIIEPDLKGYKVYDANSYWKNK